MTILLNFNFLASADEPAVEAARCLRIQSEASAEAGRRLLARCSEPSDRCDNCCQAAIDLYQRSRSILSSTRVASNSPTAHAQISTELDRARAQINGLRIQIENSGLQANSPLAARAGFQSDGRIQLIQSEVLQDYQRTINGCDVGRSFAGGDSDLKSSGQSIPAAVSDRERTLAAARRAQWIRQNVKIDYESLYRSHGPDRVGVSAANLFKMISNRFKKESASGGFLTP